MVNSVGTITAKNKSEEFWLNTVRTNHQEGNEGDLTNNKYSRGVKLIHYPSTYILFLILILDLG